MPHFARAESGKTSLIAVVSEEETIIISDLGAVQTFKMHTAVCGIRKQDECDKTWSSLQ